MQTFLEMALNLTLFGSNVTTFRTSNDIIAGNGMQYGLLHCYGSRGGLVR